MFDILCNQDPSGTGAQVGPGPGMGSPATLGDQVMTAVTGDPGDHSLADIGPVETVEQLFDRLCIGQEHAASFEGTYLNDIFDSVDSLGSH